MIYHWRVKIEVLFDYVSLMCFTQESAWVVVGDVWCYFRKLVEAPYIDSVDWSKWHVLWVDERVVPKDHDDSNYKLAYDGFLSQVCLVFLKGLSVF